MDMITLKVPRILVDKLDSSEARRTYPNRSQYIAAILRKEILNNHG